MSFMRVSKGVYVGQEPQNWASLKMLFNLALHFVKKTTIVVQLLQEEPRKLYDPKTKP